jgi:sortase A
MKRHLPTIILVLILGTGVGLLLYPTVSDYRNCVHQNRVISDYADTVKNMDNDTYDEVLDSAEEYNKKLTEKGYRWEMDEDELEEYNSQLDVCGTGIMAYLSIPKINCSLPIYHNTEKATLKTALGHNPGSSLPVGGASTHCVISGHRGLSSAKLFTDLEKLEIGDTFMIHVLNETLTYEVDQIQTVLPAEVDALKIEEGKDLCTLVTCAPNGVNKYRLLVRGHRILD